MRSSLDSGACHRATRKPHSTKKTRAAHDSVEHSIQRALRIESVGFVIFFLSLLSFVAVSFVRVVLLSFDLQRHFLGSSQAFSRPIPDSVWMAFGSKSSLLYRLPGRLYVYSCCGSWVDCSVSTAWMRVITLTALQTALQTAGVFLSCVHDYRACCTVQTVLHTATTTAVVLLIRIVRSHELYSCGNSRNFDVLVVRCRQYFTQQPQPLLYC